MRSVTTMFPRCLLLISALALLTRTAPAQVDLGTAQVSALSHSTFYDPLLGITDIYDHLISGGGSLLSVSANFDVNNEFVLTISAPAGERFLVQPLAGQTVFLSGSLRWDGPNPTGSFNPGTVSLSFGNPIGTVPTLDPSSSSQLATEHGFFGFDFQSLGFTAPFSFSSMTLTASVPTTDTGLGTLLYSPDVNSGLAFGYAEPGTGDPGPFVTLVPEPSTLSLGLLSVPFVAGVFWKRRRSASEPSI